VGQYRHPRQTVKVVFLLFVFSTDHEAFSFDISNWFFLAGAG
jgi:hypothetical protein